MLTVSGIRHPIYEARPQVYDIFKACWSSAKRAGHLKATSPNEADVLLLWGIGDPHIAARAKVARAAGQDLIMWDLAYWRRGAPLPEDVGYRMAINEHHPTKIVMARDRSAHRWERLCLPLTKTWDPNGPIILVGMGRKSAPAYGENIGQWDKAMAAKLKERFPNRHVIFRQKPGHMQHPLVKGMATDRRPIRDVLRGTSLVVCRHSNVAVDALMCGIPVVTWGGAAAAIFPSSLDVEHVPVSDEVRDRFLHNLAWFEWSMKEMRHDPEFWPALETMMEDYHEAERRRGQQAPSGLPVG